MQEQSAKQLARLSRLAYLLDSHFRLPGTNIRLGLDGIIGLLPGLGDGVATLISSTILIGARQMGAPWRVLLKMVWNLLIDLVGGSVPLIGDVFDIGFKANLRNIQLLEEYLQSQPQAEPRS